MAYLNDRVSFHEVQRMRQGWLWMILALLSLIAWYGFIQQIVLGQPFGNNPAPDYLMWIILFAIGVGLPLFFWAVRLETTVDNRGIHIRLRPFLSHTIPFAELKSCETRRYRPLIEYGGWGIRWSPCRGWAYSIRGPTGVQCVLSSGRRILIGSQEPDALASAIQAHLPTK